MSVACSARLLLGLALHCARASPAAAATTSRDNRDDARPRPPATTTARSAGPAIKVGLVTDIGGLDDRSFNFLANKGLEQAERELGVQGRVVVSRTNADYVPNLTSLAKAKYDLVIAVGFLMADALDTVAKQFPDTNFAIIDFDQAAMKSKPKNVRGPALQGAGGRLPRRLSRRPRDQAGGRIAAGDRLGRRAEDPAGRPLHRGLPGGRRKANPGIKTLNGYSQDFVDQAKCKELALDQIARGAHVIFQVAGQCGLGALSAAKEKNVRGHRRRRRPGVPRRARPHERAEEGRRRGLSDGAGRAGRQVHGRHEQRLRRRLGRRRHRRDHSDVPADLVAQVNRIQDQIASGEIKNIPDTS